MAVTKDHPTDDAQAQSDERRHWALRRLEELAKAQGVKPLKNLDEWLSSLPEELRDAPDLFEPIMAERRRQRALKPRDGVL